MIINPAYDESAACAECQPQYTEIKYFTATSGYKLKYIQMIPELKDRKKYPLIVHLHGAGSWAEDHPMPPGQASMMLKKDFPAIVIAPKTNYPMKWADHDWTKTEHHQAPVPQPSLQATYELILNLTQNDPRIDSGRIYVIGQSMGGFGTWDFITRFRDIVAAAVPVCGGGDTDSMKKIKDLPVWIFHGDADDVVPVENSRRLFAELEHLDAPVRYTEYPGVMHASWIPAYNDVRLFQWLFEQKLR